MAKKKLKLPSKIKLSNKISYDVLFSECIGTDLGQCQKCHCESVRQIVINPKQPHSEQVKTLIHEVLHAIEIEANEPVPHKYIELFEFGLYEVLRLNKLI